MKRIFCSLLAMQLALTFGCSNNTEIDLLQSKLRQQSRYVSTLEEQVDQREQELMLTQGEISQLRNTLKDEGKTPPLPEQAVAFVRVDGVQFHSYLTGPIPTNEGEQPQISVVLIPHDKNGDPVKIPAGFEIRLFDTDENNNRQLNSWQFTTFESTFRWQRDFMMTGYVFHLPWTGGSLKHQRLVAKMRTSDGRIFSTSHQFGETVADVPKFPSEETKTQTNTKPDRKTETKEPKLLVPLPPPLDDNSLVIPPFTPSPPVDSKTSTSKKTGPWESENDRIETSDRWTKEDRPVIR